MYAYLCQQLGIKPEFCDSSGTWYPNIYQADLLEADLERVVTKLRNAEGITSPVISDEDILANPFLPEGWTICIRNDREGLVEWRDSDGVGHPAPLSEQNPYVKSNWDKGHYGVHGCNGKCSIFARK